MRVIVLLSSSDENSCETRSVNTDIEHAYKFHKANSGKLAYSLYNDATCVSFVYLCIIVTVYGIRCTQSQSMFAMKNFYLLSKISECLVLTTIYNLTGLLNLKVEELIRRTKVERNKTVNRSKMALYYGCG